MSLIAQAAVDPLQSFPALGTLLRRLQILFLVFVATIPNALADGSDPSGEPAAYIALEISLPGAAPMVLLARDGQMVSYRSKALGEFIGVIPTIRDRESLEIELDVFHLVSDQESSPHRAESIELMVGLVGYEYYFALPTGVLEITLLDYAEDPKALSSFFIAGCEKLPSLNSGHTEDPGNPRNEEPGPCCVICGSTTGCGCSVNGPCGSCSGC